MKLSLAEQEIARVRLAQDTRVTETCHFWTGSISGNGYGKLRWQGPLIGAHRLAYLATGAELLSSQHILHSCDVKNCVNPAHLAAGTQQENETDKKAKGRQARGETVGTSKLTEVQVREIKQRLCSSESYFRIGRDYGVCGRTIEFIATNVTWSHIA